MHRIAIVFIILGFLCPTLASAYEKHDPDFAVLTNAHTPEGLKIFCFALADTIATRELLRPSIGELLKRFDKKQINKAHVYLQGFIDGQSNAFTSVFGSNGAYYNNHERLKRVFEDNCLKLMELEQKQEYNKTYR